MIKTLEGPKLDALSWRLERKFPLWNLSTPSIKNRLAHQATLWIKHHPARWVNNIYFDTPDQADLRKHVAGTAERIKVRLRWYGDSQSPEGKTQLEFKIRQGQPGSKLTIPLPCPKDLLINPGADLMSFVLQSELPRWARTLCLKRRPVLFNRYNRYLLSRPGSRISLHPG